MTGPRLVGAALIALVFLVLFGLSVWTIGWKHSAGIFGAALALIVVLMAGAFLLSGGAG
ncbi:hypothetical protein ACIBH1_45435 [Nonomuraea sp. NPDC050663]|uniref:hypothetical protein n=1 Tax=Nonomuraea sp. NPDC050663 TaxID=3364370 RepID=UPI0037AE301C